MSERFYSEFGEDRWIAENLPLPAHGYYVDVGCADPTDGSNTAFLRDRGWRGLAIDANPLFGTVWPPDTFVQAIISDQPIVSFEFKDNGYESRVAPGHQRFAAVPLTHLTRYPADLLSLDLEGHEYNALLSLPRPLLPPIIISEYNTSGLGEDMRVRDYLLERGYRIAHQTPANHIFFRA